MRWIIPTAFWMAIALSGVCLTLAAWFGWEALRFMAEGRGRGLGYLQTTVLALQPLALLGLIVWAIWRRSEGTAFRIIARALVPTLLMLSEVVAVYVAGNVLREAQDTRAYARSQTGSITWLCKPVGFRPGDPLTVLEPVTLRLTEQRKPGRAPNWVATWQGKKSVAVENFDVNTGSIGGSQGIRWQEADGRKMEAYLSFSDLLGEYGPVSMHLIAVESSLADKYTRGEVGNSANLECLPDPQSYRAPSDSR